MKKFTISFFLLLSIIVGILNIPLYGETSEIQVIVRGEPLTLELPPVIESGRTLVPMRDIFESLDAYVEWDGAARTVTATKGDTVIKLGIGDKTAYLNDEAFELDVPARINNGRTFVPIRFISESLDAKVGWDDTTKTVFISIDNSDEVRGNTTGNISNGGFVCKKDNWIYVSMYKNGLWKINNDGSEKVKISDNSVNYLNIVDDWMYYSSSRFLEEDDSTRLYKMKLDGSSPTKLSEDRVYYVNVVGDWIYYLNVDDNGNPYKMRLDGKGTSKISDISMNCMTVDDGWIYFQRSSDDTLCKMRTNGSDIKKLSDLNAKDMCINIIGDWIYFICDDKPGIFRVSKDGKDEELFAAGMVTSINYSDDWVYYSSLMNNLYKIKEDLSDRKNVGTDVNGDLQTADDWVYYTKYVSDVGREFRIKTDGLVKQRLDNDGPLVDIVTALTNKEAYPSSPVNIPLAVSRTTVLSPKEIAKNKDAVAFIKTYDEDGNELASGSGFNINSNGTIVTNFHVITAAESIKCTLNNTKYDVDYILNYNIIKDIAILKLKDASNLPVVQMGDSDKIELAEEVVAIGNPLELQNTVSTGIVSGIRTMFGIDYIQTNASLSPGSSGGPLFNSYGNVIGITTMSATGSQNINFAIPINSVKKLFSSSAVIPVGSIYRYEILEEEFEPNDSLETANEFILNQYIMGMFNEKKDTDYYRFELEKPGKVSFFGYANLLTDYSDTSAGFSITLLDENGKEISVSSKTTESEVDIQKITVDLEEGSYYLLIKTEGIDLVNSEYSNYMLYTILHD